jgi:hypothetical protein
MRQPPGRNSLGIHSRLAAEFLGGLRRYFARIVQPSDRLPTGERSSAKESGASRCPTTSGARKGSETGLLRRALDWRLKDRQSLQSATGATYTKFLRGSGSFSSVF